MNSLSLHAVNASSSYEVSAVNDGCYQFFTDYGVHCTVEFVLDDSLLSHETYHLVIVNVNHQKSPSDVKVRDTIPADKAILSDKDTRHPLLSDFDSPFVATQL